MKCLTFLLGLLVTVFSAGCSSAETTDSNSSEGNSSSNRIQNVDPKDLPPGLSASPVVPVNNGNVMGSPTQGTTPTPGIPDPKTLGKPMKPGATPTPGIPDPETLKRQMEEIRKTANRNTNQPPPTGRTDDGPMMRSKRSNSSSNN
jgi:hypothetical protein